MVAGYSKKNSNMFSQVFFVFACFCFVVFSTIVVNKDEYISLAKLSPILKILSK